MLNLPYQVQKGGAKMEITFDYSRLRGRIVEKYGSLREFFRHLHISEVMGYKKINETGFMQKDMVEWCRLLDIELEDVGSYFFVIKV